MVDSEENEKFDLRVKGLMTFLVNAYVVLLLSFVLSSQHFVAHFKFNLVLCIIKKKMTEELSKHVSTTWATAMAG